MESKQFTWLMNINIPNARASSILTSHSFNLVCRSRRPKNKSLRKALSTHAIGVKSVVACGAKEVFTLRPGICPQILTVSSGIGKATQNEHEESICKTQHRRSLHFSYVGAVRKNALLTQYIQRDLKESGIRQLQLCWDLVLS